MEEKLIEFVRKNKCLYDKSNPQYKMHVRTKKFEELSRKLNIPARKLKARWRTLRDTFYKKEKTGNCDRVSNNKKPWKWMGQLGFLKNVNHSNSSTPTIHARVSCRKRREYRFADIDITRDDSTSMGEASETNNDTTMNGFNFSDQRTSTVSTPERNVKPKTEQMTEESGNQDVILVEPTTTTTRTNGEDVNKVSTKSVFSNIDGEDMSRDDSTSMGEASETNNDTTMNGFNFSDQRTSTISIPERNVKPKIEQMTEESGNQDVILVEPTTTTTTETETNGKDANKVSTKSVVQLFFAGLAKQTEDANLSPKGFAKLQLKLLQVFNKEIYNISL